MDLVFDEEDLESTYPIEATDHDDVNENDERPS